MAYLLITAYKKYHKKLIEDYACVEPLSSKNAKRA
jgi:hypothetical protein